MIIEINLVPKSFYLAKRRKQMGLMLVGVGLSLAILLGGIYVTRLMKVMDLKKRIAQIEKEQQQYTEILKQIEDIKKDEAVLIERNAIYDSLMKEQKIWPEILDKLNKAVPPNLCITSVTNSGTKGAGRSFTLLGSAVSKGSVASFIDNLKDSNFFMDPTFDIISDTGPGNVARISYTVTFKTKE